LKNIFLYLSTVSVFLFSLANAKQLKPESLPQDSVILMGEQAFEKGNYKEAVRFLDYFVLNYPTDERVPKAQFHLAESYYDMKQFDDASMEFEFLYKQFPGSEYSEQAQVKAALSKFETSEPYYKEQTVTLEVQKDANDFLNRNPNSQFAPEARKLLAKIDEKLATKELAAAKLYFRFKEYNASVMSLEYILAQYPLAKATNLETSYYLGLCKEALGEKEEAQAIMEELATNPKWQKKAQKVLDRIAKAG
jgi:outer membrane protein assembly factor BamD